MNRYQLLGIEKDEEGNEWSFVFDTETKETFKSPVYINAPKEEAPKVTVIPRRETAAPKPSLNWTPPSEERKSVVPAVLQAEPVEEVEEKTETPVPVKNPHAIPRPQYAWQDENWEAPETRKKIVQSPPPGHTDVMKIFKNPSEFGEKDSFTMVRKV